MMRQTREMLESLKRPEAYDSPVKEIKMIQTHISWVFLTGDFVYKIKKPVDFGFLDYTMLDKRKKFCMKELEINKMFSKDLYVGVLPVNNFQGSIKINGPGDTIDYAIKMRQLPQESLMDKLLGKNLVEPKTIDRIVDILMDFYSKTQTFTDPNAIGGIGTVKFNWKENFSQTHAFIGKTIDEGTFNTIKNNVEIFIENSKDLFGRRLRDGKVKWCHGDLHSGNIFVVKDDIYIFDGIDFNERFACSDVANDVAFLSMDLDSRHRKFLSDYFIKKYVEKSGDEEIRKLLNFYKCYRAYVRGKVLGFRLDDPNIPEHEKNEAKDTAKIYFQLALDYARNF